MWRIIIGLLVGIIVFILYAQYNSIFRAQRYIEETSIVEKDKKDSNNNNVQV